MRFLKEPLGPLFDGIGHMVVTPEALLPVVALSLLAGLGGKPYARTVLFMVVAGWLEVDSSASCSAGVPRWS